MWLNLLVGEILTNVLSRSTKHLIDMISVHILTVPTFLSCT